MSLTNVENNSFIFSVDSILDSLKQLANPDNETRNQAEFFLSSLKYEIKLYETLFFIFKSDNVEKYYKLQSILLMKNLIRTDLSACRIRRGIENGTYINNLEIMKNVHPILDYLQKALVELINFGKVDKTYFQHLKEIFLLVGDKRFPSDWNELWIIFSEIYKTQVESIFSDLNLYNMTIILNQLFYSLLKQNNQKRSPLTRNRFLQCKLQLLELFLPFYQRVLTFFTQNSSMINNIDQLKSYLTLLQSNDKILLILIDSSFNISDFHKDEQVILMLTTILERAVNILNAIIGSEDEIKSILMENLYKILKYCGKIQSANPVLFYRDLEKYLNILFYVIFNANIFPMELMKVVMYNLNKVINTVAYKELTEELPQRKYSQGDNKTPEKPKRSVNNLNNLSNLNNLNNLVSPSKFKNFELQLRDANDCFYRIFNEENIFLIIKSFLEVLPFTYSKEIDQVEVELLSEMEDEILGSETFSTNTMSWHTLYRSLLESLISNFQASSLRYINLSLSSYYSSQTNPNVLLLDSFSNFVNIIPNLYKYGSISEMDIIDYHKFICFLESKLASSDIIVKKYIVTITRWSEVLISNDSIFNYIENLLFFLKNSQNNFIMIEAMLAFKIIISHFDRILKTGQQNFNIHVDKNKLEMMIHNTVNWSDLLFTVSKVCLGWIHNIKSAELLLAIINLFTMLIQKCHYQCDGKIVEIIRDSGFPQVIQNLNDEFAQHAFTEMWKSLLLSFPESGVIINLTLQFISVSFRKEINMNNLGLLLFLVRVVEATDEIRSNIAIFLKEHIIIFKSEQKQYLSVLLFNILEEIMLMDIFGSDDCTDIISICTSKYLPLFDKSKMLLLRQTSEIQESDSILYSDICEYKSSILNVIYTLISKDNIQKKDHVIYCCDLLIKTLLQEISIKSPDYLHSAQFVSSLVNLINRITLLNFDFLQECLNSLIQEGLPLEEFFSEWLIKMDQLINKDSRKLNILTLCKLMPFLNRNSFLNSINTILNICLIPVHSEMLKKLDGDLTHQKYCFKNIKKTIHIRQSWRRREIYENDPLLDIDLHCLFVENFKAALTNKELSLDFLISNFLRDNHHINTLNDILGCKL